MEGEEVEEAEGFGTEGEEEEIWMEREVQEGIGMEREEAEDKVEVMKMKVMSLRNSPTESVCPKLLLMKLNGNRWWLNGGFRLSMISSVVFEIPIVQDCRSVLKFLFDNAKNHPTRHRHSHGFCLFPRLQQEGRAKEVFRRERVLRN